MRQLYFQYAYFLSENQNVSFDLNRLKELETAEDRINYAATTLPLLSNEGGGRIVFDLGDKVLKIARNNNNSFQGGVNQNKKEIQTYQKLKSLDMFPELYAFDPNGEWVIFEKVNTFSSDDKNALEKYFGLYDEELERLFGWDAGHTPDEVIHPEKYPDKQEEIEEYLDFYDGWRENPYIKKIFALIEAGIHPEELLVRSHYGLTNDGRLVLVDFGH